ncbi:MAG: DNA recombination protein RmuC [Lentihominibacter sp.]
MDNVTIGIIIAAGAVILLLIAVIVTTQSSIRNLGGMIADNQKEAADRQRDQLARQDERISQINTSLADSMNRLNVSLGEMKNLASGVEDLKRLMSNVKSRGILGEVQLGAILEDILSPEQYDENVAVKGGSERVEYAVKFPGEDGSYVYLPIDSKFPGDAYLNLLDAYDSGDRTAVKKGADALRHAITKAARDIKDKYIYPPLTTDFAIMFLPFEGLYAEVLRLNLVETLQREYRINVAGPTTMGAMLNSFQLGFRALALRQNSGEVWDTLQKVRTEFDKFASVLDNLQNRLDQSQKELEKLVGVRTRSIQKVLDKVSRLSDTDKQEMMK